MDTNVYWNLGSWWKCSLKNHSVTFQTLRSCSVQQLNLGSNNTLRLCVMQSWGEGGGCGGDSSIHKVYMCSISWSHLLDFIYKHPPQSAIHTWRTFRHTHTYISRYTHTHTDSWLQSLAILYPGITVQKLYMSTSVQNYRTSSQIY